MFHKIMIPVDLAHVEGLDKALRAGADLARIYVANVTYVGASTAAPSAVAHTPAEFADKLAAFAAGETAKYGHTAESRAITSHDPKTDIDDALLRAAEELGADLVVMASHVPGLTDTIWPSNGGKLAARAKASVMVVRPG
jgi:nucleotide-binding universal stress UspA family protein